MYNLFYFPRNASWAPHLVLEEIGVDYRLTLVDRKSREQKSEDYLTLNPTGRIPTLVDDDTVIFESAAICLYLCEQHPQANLIPKVGDPNRALFYQWLFYLTATLQPELMLYIYPDKHTESLADVAPIIQTQESIIADMFALLDKQLEGKEYLVGDHLTACDYFLFMLSHWSRELKQPPLSFGNLGLYLRRIAKRPAMKKVCVIEGTNLEDYD